MPFVTPQRNQEDLTVSKLSQAQKGEHGTVHSDVESNTAILTEVENRRAGPGTVGIG